MSNGKEDKGEDLVTRLVNQIPDPNWKEIARGGGLVDRFAGSLGKDELKTNQMRKFFDEIKKIDREQREDVEWERIEGNLYQLIPMIKYANARKLCPKKFVMFINGSIEEVCKDDNGEKSEKLKNFSKIFEYVVAYYKYIEKGGK